VTDESLNPADYKIPELGEDRRYWATRASSRRVGSSLADSYSSSPYLKVGDGPSTAV
jgi:hypothetical protein